jgi:hypothetical protein
MQARPGHLWSAQATPAAMLYLPVLCRRTAHISDRTSSRLSQLALPSGPRGRFVRGGKLVIRSDQA